MSTDTSPTTPTTTTVTSTTPTTTTATTTTAPSTSAEAAPEIDMDALMAFVFRAVDEVGATLNAALVVLGDKLGYYRDLAAHGASTPGELAQRTGTAEPYAREWLNAQAAGNFVTYDPGAGRYTLPAEQAVALTVEDSPAFLPGLFQIALGTVHDMDHILAAARNGAGFGWHEHVTDVHLGCERFFRPSYHAHLVQEWLPALDGVVDKLRAGAHVADIGCGHGSSTVLMAHAFPQSRFIGYDYHPESIAIARQRAQDAGVADRVRFAVATAQSLPSGDFDLITMFDCLHDMGDPVGAAEQVHQALQPDGTWMVVEPMAGEHVEDNLNPVGRAYYGFSTLLCTPASLSQDVGLALGTQAGPARIRDVATAAGFTRFGTVAQTPFNRVMEIRR
ncbi:class I SAM-dependent methyltransferase [Ornithinimicrobium sp. F0845]|uniref:class I SAM-dependent methyltransferase n=1 Tax=Ornithinimicrobium sp. F0845 TaxID=2926412 RepID=UPI001FF613DA|nr:class I SAM-dependent methyltransferase [Ornithinimicrobium sp. F0845]MCK0112808.1 class I SAM-dependent methyltransferase [Ornithinimicrobium sp. F0845]